MQTFSSLVVAACVSIFASGAVAAPAAAATKGQVYVLSGYPFGCVNVDGAFTYQTGDLGICPNDLSGVLSKDSITLSTSKGPCGIESGILKCSATTAPTTFAIDAFQPYPDSFFFGNGNSWSGTGRIDGASDILNSKAEFFEYQLVFKPAA